MNDQYQYFEQHLTPSIAQELIQGLFEGETVRRQVIIRRVDEVHEGRGGYPPQAESQHPVVHALLKMKEARLAENPERGLWSIFIKTLNGFTKWAKKFTPGKYVFRGIRNETYGIQASAYRRLKEEDKSFLKFLQINKDLIDETVLRGYDERNGRQLSQLEMLAELQHHGAATCLIDFTYSAQIALWFACGQDSKTSQDSENSPNGKVFAVHNQLPNFKEVKSEMLKDNIDDFLQDEENSPLYYWQPRQQNNRIIAQQSIFLFGRPEFEADDECVILVDSKENIQTELEQVSGITEAMLFPDFEKFASLRGVGEPYIGLSVYECRELAQEQFQEGNYSEAIAYCDRAIDQDPNYIEAYYERGRARHCAGQYSSAVSDLDKFINQNPDYAEAYAYRGDAKLHLGEVGEAEADFLVALRLAEESRDWALANEIGLFLDEIYEHTAEGEKNE
ncbi:MAG: tetratricopeptide repeat protein [Candidatus Poribacteria bacterium]|nr:tetratricopeptide repeat protein [Candidatus Poribacteria bacterium]